MNETYDLIFSIISAALFNTELASADGAQWEVAFSEMRLQGVSGLIGRVLNKIPSIDDNIKKTWKEHVIHRVVHSERLVLIQSEVQLLLKENGISFVVLKGTSAAVYYPEPLYRSMGDIDIIVLPAQYELACALMTNAGYQMARGQTSARHTSYTKHGVHIELHYKFTAFDSKKASLKLDELIYDAIPRAQEIKYENITSLSLPTLENGLVIIEHVAHHLRTGVGLKPVIDWMMYVNTYLDNAYWETNFKISICSLGLERFAIALTKLCNMYLGLPIKNHEWCNNADEALCSKLMQTIMDSGNYAIKKQGADGKAESVLNSAHGIKWIKQLHSSGKVHWIAAKKYPILKPFAGIYALLRYIRIYISQSGKSTPIWQILVSRKKYSDIFRELDL